MKVKAIVKTSSKTGVEMEALTAVTISCLTIYDMCKYYEGFLGKITDFRKTDKIEGLGYYTITNIQLTGKVEELNNEDYLFRYEHVL